MRCLCLAGMLLLVACAGESGEQDPSDAGPSCSPHCPVVSLTAGGHHNCVLRTDGTVACWGSNAEGQLSSAAEGGSSAAWVQVPGLGRAVSVAAGYAHTCAVLAGGTVKCWGDNSFHQLDFHTVEDSPEPVTIAGLSDAVAVSAGRGHSCVVHSHGGVSCWGYNQRGQLGMGSTAWQEAPVAAKDLAGAVSLGLGHSHSCAVLADGSLECWGEWDCEYLGTEVVPHEDHEPTLVVGQENVSAVACGATHTCLLADNNSVYCWGRGTSGQLGLGDLVIDCLGDTVPGLSDVISVAAGSFHTCSAHADGSTHCWGRNMDGQLGDGSTESSGSPVPVAGLQDAVQVAAGSDHSCALRAGGEIQCWGSNRFGQLGE